MRKLDINKYVVIDDKQMWDDFVESNPSIVWSTNTPVNALAPTAFPVVITRPSIYNGKIKKATPGVDYPTIQSAIDFVCEKHSDLRPNDLFLDVLPNALKL